ncbi:hypothetical protein C8F04DRAFT_1340876 [Mycena alexandri]|uniref:Peptidase M20 dimerisation domain-containing protein n=1 Tax=Mycena alexandri TaxID=1745969 RepID=A0AAD6T1Y4_9AGAR|nr:hypothetical protein C8F04DRAFT_1340876 [Mycena alexandri]
MEENGSEGLDELVDRERDGWYKGVDCMCISDNYWLNMRTPALTYGLRGLVYFKINVSGPGRDLHSGVFGRTVHEPMTDLISFMLVPGVDGGRRGSGGDVRPACAAQTWKPLGYFDTGVDGLQLAFWFGSVGRVCVGCATSGRHQMLGE